MVGFRRGGAGQAASKAVFAWFDTVRGCMIHD